MTGLKEIRQGIISDQENQQFTKKGWQPIYLVNHQAKIVIIGPAPGIKTQAVGQPFRDQSGERLRTWLDVSADIFYNSGKIAVLPLDFYFPGKAKVGDLPPRPGFSEKWHPQLLAQMPEVELIILMGIYAQKQYLKTAFKGTLTKTVFAYQEFLPTYFPIVHSSPLNFRWLTKNPEFEPLIVPKLRDIVHQLLSES